MGHRTGLFAFSFVPPHFDRARPTRKYRAFYMRRADAEAKAMAIGNITDVLRLKTVSPLQKCECRKAGKDCYVLSKGGGL